MMSFTMDELLDKSRLPLDYGREHGHIFRPLLEALSVHLQNAYFCDSDLTISVTGDAEKLKLVWGTILRAGFKSPADRPKVGQPNYNGWFRHTTNNACCVYLTFGSTVCRRVKVGTKTVEQDVYETICEDIVMPEAV